MLSSIICNVVVSYLHSVSESEHMEDAKSGHPGPFTLSATGRPSMMWSQWLGDFILTKKQHGGRPVYRNREGKHLYTTEKGAWAVSVTVGNCTPVYRSTDPAASPALCKQWEYRNDNRDVSTWDGDDGKYLLGDIKVTCKNNFYSY